MLSDEYNLGMNILSVINILSIVMRSINTMTEEYKTLLNWIVIQFIIN